jgi:hypothetical protein
MIVLSIIFLVLFIAHGLSVENYLKEILGEMRKNGK